MTRKLEELFHLPSAPVLGQTDTTQDEEVKSHIEENRAILAAADNAIDKIDIALPTVTDLETSDKELDDLADLAKNTFTSLIDLSMNVEPRFSGPILQSASTLLGHAVNAKIAKIDKKLKMVDLQIRKAKVDLVREIKSPSEKAVEGEGVIIDRNELLKSILAANKKELADSHKNDK